MLFRDILWLLILGSQAVFAQITPAEAELDYEEEDDDDSSILDLTWAHSAFETSNSGLPVERSGNYGLRGCAKDGETAYLQVMLPQFSHNLQAAADEALKGRASPAFSAFFKSDENKIFVAKVLNDIADGSLSPNMDAQSPMFACITDDNKPLLDLCNEHPNTKLVALNDWIAAACPNFFRMRSVWWANVACPRVRSHGDYEWQPYQRPENQNLLDSQYATFVAHYTSAYLPISESAKVTKSSLQDCAALSPIEAIHNPMSYAWFAAGRLGLIMLTKSV